MFINVVASGTNVRRLAKVLGKKANAVIYTAYSQIESEPGMIRRKFYRTFVSDELVSQIQSLRDEEKPSWSKIWAKPLQNRVVIENLFNSLVGEDTLRPELNLSNLADEDVECFMVFVNADNKQMSQIRDIIARAIPSWEVQVLNGDYTSNFEAQYETRKALHNAKATGKRGLIVLSNQMGSRSYSISEIQATVLAFDSGSADTSSQKASRALTPGATFSGKDKMYGYIVDLSFNPNRSENIEKLFVDEATLLMKSGDAESFTTAISIILKSANLFKVDEWGFVEEIKEDELFKVFNDNENLLKVADQTVDIEYLLENHDQLLDKILEMKVQKGKSEEKSVPINEGVKNRILKESESDEDEGEKEVIKKDIESKIRARIQTLNLSATSVYYLSGMQATSYRGCLNVIEGSNDLSQEFKDFYDIAPDIVRLMLDAGILNEPILDTVVVNSVAEPSERLF
jgi:hypothetical protein